MHAGVSCADRSVLRGREAVSASAVSNSLPTVGARVIDLLAQRSDPASSAISTALQSGTLHSGTTPRLWVRVLECELTAHHYTHAEIPA
jgi:hypothetical protein